MPFYDKNALVAKFIEKLLSSRDAGLQLDAAVSIIKK